MSRDFVQEYNDFLDECYPMIEMMGIKFYPSTVLKECDPIAYDCGFYDYMDSIGIDRDCADY